jgi:uncharacterized membrane protein YuzA (DUF378 family)
MSSLNALGKIAWVLVIVGGLNWGLVGINAEWNLVEMLLGAWPMVVKVVYLLVGISALVSVFGLGKKSAPAM